MRRLSSRVSVPATASAAMARSYGEEHHGASPYPHQPHPYANPYYQQQQQQQAYYPSYTSTASTSHSQPRRHPVLDPNHFRARPRVNTVLNIVPQGEMWVVERLGKYLTTLTPGMWFLMPAIDRIQYVHSSKEQGIPIPHQSAITRDNVMLDIDGVLFLRVVDAASASYNIDNPIFNLINIAQTTMRSEIGKLTLDALFEERDKLNQNIIESIKREAVDWGVECKRYEIRDIAVSDIVRKSMDLQAEAERRKRKVVLESEGERDAAINQAVGRREAAKQDAEARKYATIAQAEADYESATFEANANAVRAVTLGKALDDPEKGPSNRDALQYSLASQYVVNLGKFAKNTNTLLMPSNVGDASSVLASAMSVVDNVKGKTLIGGAVPPPAPAAQQKK
eukprot:PhM_4_TR15439/c0_g1_i1/m.22483